jgi:hypothetical protein
MIAGGLWLGIRVAQISHRTHLLLELRLPTLLWLVSSAAADTALTGSLVFYLVRRCNNLHGDHLWEHPVQARRKSGFPASLIDDVINKVSHIFDANVCLAHLASEDYPLYGPNWVNHGTLRDSGRPLLRRTSRKSLTPHEPFLTSIYDLTCLLQKSTM